LSGADKQEFGTALTGSGREEVLLGAFRFVRRNMLGGDYLEFGVYRGHTIHLAYAFSEYMSKSVQGWLRADERAEIGKNRIQQAAPEHLDRVLQHLDALSDDDVKRILASSTPGCPEHEPE